MTNVNRATLFCGLWLVGVTVHGQGTTASPASLPLAAPWAPQLTAEVNPPASGAIPQFQLHLQGMPFTPYALEVSADLRLWVSLTTNLTAGDGAFDLIDPRFPELNPRFYRARLGRDRPSSGTITLDPGGFRPDRVLVKPRLGVDLTALNATLGTQVLQVFPAIGGLEVLQLPAGKTAPAIVTLYQQSGLVAYAEADYAVRLLLTPNDFRYANGDMWNLHNVGQYGGTPGADVDAPDGWNVQYTATNVIVAVIDTGVRYTHEDLAANLWTQPGSTNHGINTITGTNDPWDDYGHGTHLSGTIGAVGNNSVGTVGVAWTAQMMECKFLDAQGNGTISDAITCIDYARTHGAKILNASWGTTTFKSAALHDAIASARDAGMIFVAACGNSHNDNDGPNAIYPASYTDLDNVVAVAATDRGDQLSSFSNYGAHSVQLGAPGEDVFSTYNQNDSSYVAMSGTSMAAANVSGVFAVVWAHYAEENYQQILQRVLSNTVPVAALQGKTITGGRPNLFRALTAATPSPSPSSPSANFTANPSSGNAPLTVQFTDQSTGTVTAWDWRFGDGSPDASAQNPSHTYTNAGTFTVTLTVTGGGGTTSSKSAAVQANTPPPPPPTANFTANPTSGNAPLAVQFTDQSTGTVTAWDWSFGDGLPDSSAQNPSHTYVAPGDFTATLMVTGNGGATSGKSVIIHVVFP